MSRRNSERQVVLNQRLVKDHDRARARELRRVLWIGAGLLVPILFHVWQQVEYIRYGYQVERLQKQKNQLVDWNEQLKLEKATLTDLHRIERIASKKLGLVPPTSENTKKIRLTGEPTATESLARREMPVDGLAAAER